MPSLKEILERVNQGHVSAGPEGFVELPLNDEELTEIREDFIKELRQRLKEQAEMEKEHSSEAYFVGFECGYKSALRFL